MMREVGSGRFTLSLSVLGHGPAQVVGSPCLTEAVRAAMLLAGACSECVPVEIVLRDGLLPVLWFSGEELECTADVRIELQRVVMELRNGDQHVPPAVSWLLDLVPTAGGHLEGAGMWGASRLGVGRETNGA